MNSFVCPECGTDIVVRNVIVGCEHYPKDEFIEMSGKLMSDSVPEEEADRMAFRMMTRQKELF